MKSRHSRHFGDGIADENGCGVLTPGLMRKNTEQMQCVGMARVGPQDLFVEPFCVHKAPGLVVAHGGRQ